jgi:hypothetical protein
LVADDSVTEMPLPEVPVSFAETVIVPDPEAVAVSSSVAHVLAKAAHTIAAVAHAQHGALQSAARRTPDGSHRHSKTAPEGNDRL